MVNANGILKKSKSTGLSCAFTFLESRLFWWIVLLIVLISRLLTTIYYIEEPDAMRFAQAVHEFNITKLQPHFPGYPVFVLFTKVLAMVTGRFSLAFSLIGGLGIFLILFSISKIAANIVKGASRWVLLLILFCNPYLWVMSNSYMPDLFASGLVCLAFYFFTVAYHRQGKYNVLFQFLAGMLAGVRLSYLPVLVVPSLYLLFKQTSKWQQLMAGLVGILIWLVPFIAVSGWDEVVRSATAQTEGHFFEWGGTYITDDSLHSRFVMMIRGIWADGLGAYWNGRGFQAVANAVGLALLLIGALVAVFQKRKADLSSWVIFVSVLVYMVWIFFFQNIIYKARHVLPLIPFVILFLATGAGYWLRGSKRAVMLLIIAAFLINYTVFGLFIAIQHTKPTAIAQAAEYLKKHARTGDSIISIPLINDYMSAQKIPGEYLIFEDELSLRRVIEHNKRIFFISVAPVPSLGTQNYERFYHNPFVNRMWPVVEVRQYE